MAIRIAHVSRGLAGLHAANSEELHHAITQLTTNGFTVDTITDDASEPWHVASIHYDRPQDIDTIQQLVGAPGAYRNRR